MIAESPAPQQPQAGTAVTVTGQYIKDFSFENPNAPQIFTAINAAPEIGMGVNVQSRGVGENAYEVLLALKLDAKIEDKTAFIAELTYGGVFNVPPMPEEHLRMFLLVEAPRLLFPFARSILAGAVREGGFPHVMINPIDFTGLYMANKGNISTMQTAGAA